MAILALSVVLTAPFDAHADDTVDQIKVLHTQGLEAYDFFEFDKATAAFSEAIELAKANGVRDPIVAKVYVSKGILFHAQFKDTAPQVAESKTFDEFVAAVSIDYNVEIPEDYRTDELVGLLARAREIVPPPSGGNGNTNNNGGGGDVRLRHDALAVADACQPLNVVAMVPAHPDAFRAYLHYRPIDGTFESIELSPSRQDPEAFEAAIPVEATASGSLAYYIEVVNRQQATVAAVGSRSEPVSVTLIGECNLDQSDVKLVQIAVEIGTGLGFADGDTENCKTTPDCFGEGQSPDRFKGVRPGLAPAPLHINTELNFNVLDELQIGLYGRIQLVEFAWAIGAKIRYFLLSEGAHRIYTGVGLGYGGATYTVNLGSQFNNFTDIVVANGPAHIGFNLGYHLAFSEYVGLGIDFFAPVHFPDFTFHFDLSIGPYVQF